MFRVTANCLLELQRELEEQRSIIRMMAGCLTDLKQAIDKL